MNNNGLASVSRESVQLSLYHPLQAPCWLASWGSSDLTLAECYRIVVVLPHRRHWSCCVQICSAILYIDYIHYSTTVVQFFDVALRYDNVRPAWDGDHELSVLTHTVAVQTNTDHTDRNLPPNVTMSRFGAHIQHHSTLQSSCLSECIACAHGTSKKFRCISHWNCTSLTTRRSSDSRCRWTNHLCCHGPCLGGARKETTYTHRHARVCICIYIYIKYASKCVRVVIHISNI